MREPKPLFSGARVALVAPAGAVPPERLEAAFQAVREFGLVPVPFETCFLSHGYLAGTDRERARDVNLAFSDPSVDGILCMRGGYGCQRIMHLIDYGAAARHPKFFCGYSDITALHIAFNQNSGLITCHGPMPATEWYRGLDPFTADSLRGAMQGTQCVLRNPPESPARALVPGKAEGRLAGGNLTLVCASLGTPWEIDTRGRILFLEDVGEPPYRIDGKFTQLRGAGKFRDCRGVVLGNFKNCTPADAERSLSLTQVCEEAFCGLRCPVLAGFACGHAMPSLSLPLGAWVRLDAGRGEITVCGAKKNK